MREPLFKLTRSQRDEMERRQKRTSDRRVAERIHAILLLNEGRNLKETSSILRIHPKTISRWIKIFSEYGIDELCSMKYENSGRNSKLNEEQELSLDSYLSDKNLSTKEIISWLEKEFKISYSESGLVKLLKKMNYTYKKPSIIPSKADPVAQSAWIKEYDKKKEN